MFQMLPNYVSTSRFRSLGRKILLDKPTGLFLVVFSGRFSWLCSKFWKMNANRKQHFENRLSISAIIGIFWAWRDRNKSTEEYMLGGGNVNFIPIAMSLATTFFSAIAVLGIPAEFYIYGTMYTYFLVPYLICTILSAEIFGPIYMDMGLTSTYEYLEVRFFNWSRLLNNI